MNFLRFLFSKAFYLNVFIAILITVGLVFATLSWLDQYTNHGESKSLPDFSGTHISELPRVFEENKLRFEVIDTITSDDHEKGTVIDQTPSPYSLVKDNRTIYLTINSDKDEMIRMPNLTSGSPKIAITKLKNAGLKLDSIWPVPGKYNDLVIDQILDSMTIQTGTMVKKGTAIVLKVSKTNIETELVFLPDFTGMSQEEAKEKAELLGLELTRMVCTSCMNELDSLSATVVRQYPEYSEGKQIKPGELIDLFYEPL